MNNTDIKFNDHFKLHILFKDKIIFEAEMIANGLSFHLDPVQFGDDCQYFLLDNDRPEIDEILIANKIIASTDTSSLTDYDQVRKRNKLYLYFAAAITLLLFVATLIASAFT